MMSVGCFVIGMTMMIPMSSLVTHGFIVVPFTTTTTITKASLSSSSSSLWVHDRSPQQSDSCLTENANDDDGSAEDEDAHQPRDNDDSSSSFSSPSPALLCIQSWKQVQSIPSYKAVAGELLFRRIFTISPAAKSLFKFATKKDNSDHDNNDDDEAFYQSTEFQKHAAGVISTVDQAMIFLANDKMDDLVETLKELGGKHFLYGVQREHYPIVGQALLETLEIALGDNEFTIKVKEAWTSVWGIIMDNMLIGATITINSKENLTASVKDDGI